MKTKNESCLKLLRDWAPGKKFVSSSRVNAVLDVMM